MSSTADDLAVRAAERLLSDIDRAGVLTNPAGMTDADILRLAAAGRRFVPQSSQQAAT